MSKTRRPPPEILRKSHAHADVDERARGKRELLEELEDAMEDSVEDSVSDADDEAPADAADERDPESGQPESPAGRPVSYP